MVLNRGYKIVFGLACAFGLIYLLQHEIQKNQVKIEMADQKMQLTQLEIQLAKLIDRPSLGCQEYRNKCFALYKALRYPNTKYLFNPPVKEIPEELIANFTQNGFMPLGK